MTLDLAGCTHVGLKRSENQDEVFAQVLSKGSRTVACLAVADGMGGHLKGREASQAAITTVREKLIVWLRDEQAIPDENWCKLLEEEAHLSVRSISSSREIAGTTLTVGLIVGEEFIIGHVGDSRAYYFRDGILKQITEDQTWEEFARKNNVENKHGNALLQAIGVDDRVAPDTYRIELEEGDWLLMCSDGLYKMVDEANLRSAIAVSVSASDACNRLLALALDAGGRDNVGICVARLTDPGFESRKINLPLLIACGALAVVLFLMILALSGKI